MSQPAAKATSNTVSKGECSSHSPGCSRGGSASSLAETSTPIASAVTALASEGADQRAITTEIAISTTAITIDCHRKIVSVNGITPVIGSKDAGKLAGLACSCAADELKPRAQVAPSPR